MLLSFWKDRLLIWTLVKKELKVRYKGSALGFLWSFGRPLFLMLIMWAVFSRLMGAQALRNEKLPYALHLLGGILPWMYLSGALSESLHSLLGHSNMIKKMALPTQVFPIATVLSHLVHFFLALILLFVFMAFAGVWPTWKILWLPVLILCQTTFILGLALLLSSLHVFYRDVASLTEIGITAWFYLTPIIYPIYRVEAKLHEEGREGLLWAFLMNPMAGLVAGYRSALFDRALNPPEISDAMFYGGIGWSLAASAVVWVIAIPVYRKLSQSFADEL